MPKYKALYTSDLDLSAYILFVHIRTKRVR